MEIKDLIDLIQEKVGDAYEIGHCHGMNAYRLLNKEPMKRENEGWAKYSEEIEQKVQQYLIENNKKGKA